MKKRIITNPQTEKDISAHTPGPWKLDGTGFIEGVNDYAGCGSYECEWHNKSDKTLVLAAPELLKSAKMLLSMLEHIDTICGGLPKGFKGKNGLSSNMEEARAAIAKAEGK